jgi:hypothetical protein
MQIVNGVRNIPYLQMHGAHRLLIIAERRVTNPSSKRLDYTLIHSDLLSLAAQHLRFIVEDHRHALAMCG